MIKFCLKETPRFLKRMKRKVLGQIMGDIHSVMYPHYTDINYILLVLIDVSYILYTALGPTRYLYILVPATFWHLICKNFLLW